MVSASITRNFISVLNSASLSCNKQKLVVYSGLRKQSNTWFDQKAYSTKDGDQKKSSPLKIGFATLLGGTVIGGFFAYNEIQKKNKIKVANPGSGLQSLFVDEPPKDKVARKICSPIDKTGLKLVLYQYQPCPFCTKVRAFLDYYGFAYEVVEVNPVMRTEVKWSNYKKVPIVIAKVADGYQQLVDSSLIISVLQSLLYDKNMKLEDLLKFYPMVEFVEDGTKNTEIMNKYFLMLQDSLPKGKTKEDIVEERKWRRWADSTLVHQLSPNVYRTWEEALQAFKYFSMAGDWENIFPDWQRQIVIYVGALAMYFVGKRLKKRHNLRDDVRQSLYEEVNIWLKALQKKGTPFMGGNAPDLGDLAVYGCLNSIEGCKAFQDLLVNTKIRHWYENMRNAIGHRQGQALLAEY
ncbi:prostaglandin E synthase 2-like [Artemia franciscana]|uniref:Prostaglandin E synthase 2 n=1 Tax=Artemia franciscana TaxID=6661 RepID=A0AA88I1M1_ARTSF|nr:hypothetical protein QYM36_004968 [Artemia franciscana]